MTNVKSIKSEKPTTTALDRQAQIEARLRQIPTKYKKLYLRAVAGNRPAACRCQCLECVGWAKLEVRLCTDLGCPLYAVRPYRPK
jgi:hypothetical protein